MRSRYRGLDGVSPSSTSERIEYFVVGRKRFQRFADPGRGGAACPAPVDRLRSDFVMGLAVIHHVVASSEYRSLALATFSPR